MSSKFNELEAEVLHLSDSERALLANHLLSSLEKSDIDPELEKIWALEAENRYQQYVESEAKTDSATQALEAARASLKSGN